MSLLHRMMVLILSNADMSLTHQLTGTAKTATLVSPM